MLRFEEGYPTTQVHIIQSETNGGMDPKQFENHFYPNRIENPSPNKKVSPPKLKEHVKKANTKVCKLGWYLLCFIGLLAVVVLNFI